MKTNISVTLDIEDLRTSMSNQDRSKIMSEKVLAIFNQLDIKATIFIVGDVATLHPELVKRAVSEGHEIGLHAHEHKPLEFLRPKEFLEKTMISRKQLQEISGQPILGYRAPTMSLTFETKWAISMLQEIGFTYSSSVLPAKNPLYGWPGLPQEPFMWKNSILEFPCPVTRILGFDIPYLSGTYFRLLPSFIRKNGIKNSSPKERLWTYCHPWEFDTDEKFYKFDYVGKLTNRIAWLGRSSMEKKIKGFLKNNFSQTLGEVAETIDYKNLKSVDYTRND